MTDTPSTDTPPSPAALMVAPRRVVSFHYDMHSLDGELLESTREGDPVVTLFGQGDLLQGLENTLKARTAGEHIEVTLAPEQAFGAREADQVKRLSKKYFANPARLSPGMVTALRTEHGTKAVTVLKVGSKVVDVDMNHPRAGETLVFTLDVIDVREATKEELSHGHVHGTGGHHH